MSPLDIKMQVEREEKTEKKEAQKSVVMKSSSLKYERNTDPEVIAQKQKEYLNENKNQFADLISQVRQRKNKGNEKKSSDDEKTSNTDDRISDTVSEKNSIAENVSEVSESVLDNLKDFDEEFRPEDHLEVNIRSSSLSKTLSNESLDIFDTSNKESSQSSSSDNFVSGQKSQKSQLVSQRKSQSQNVVLESPRAVGQKTKFKSPPLYITPNKKSSTNSLTPNSKLRQVGISQGFSSQQSDRSNSRKDPCPVCNQLVPSLHINAHLDRCLNPGQKRKNQDDDDDFVSSEIEKSMSNKNAAKKKKLKSEKENDTELSLFVVADSESDEDIVEIEPNIREEANILPTRLRNKGKSLQNGKSAPKKSSKRLANRNKDM